MGLQQAREAYEKRFFTQRCSITRTNPGDASIYGTRQNTEQVLYTKLPCRAQKASRPQRIEEGHQHVAIADWEVLLPVSCAVSLSDKITVGADEYEVRGSNAGGAGALVLTAYCIKVS